jgi:hypothetical protein
MRIRFPLREVQGVFGGPDLHPCFLTKSQEAMIVMTVIAESVGPWIVEHRNGTISAGAQLPLHRRR